MPASDNSQLFRKFVIRITIQKNACYTVWGCDTSDNDQDKLLVDEHKRIILLQNNDFRNLLTIQGDMSFLFDKDNFLQWLSKSTSFQSCADYDFDKLLITEFSDNMEKEFADNAFHCLLLFSDYAYQTKNRKFIAVYKSLAVSKFMTAMYDINLWKSKDGLGGLFSNALFVRDLKSRLVRIHGIVSDNTTIII